MWYEAEPIIVLTEELEERDIFWLKSWLYTVESVKMD